MRGLIRVSVEVALFGILAAIIFSQGKRIQLLQTAVEEVAFGDSLAPGTVLPSFRAVDVSGKEHEINYGAANARPRIFYALTPSCGWCRANHLATNSLARQISARYDIIGLSLSEEGLVAFAKDTEAEFPILKKVPDSIIKAYHLQGTPATIVVSAEGKVIKGWRGAYGVSLQPVIEKFFSVRLPPLSNGSPAAGFSM